VASVPIVPVAMLVFKPETAMVGAPVVAPVRVVVTLDKVMSYTLPVSPPTVKDPEVTVPSTACAPAAPVAVAAAAGVTVTVPPLPFSVTLPKARSLTAVIVIGAITVVVEVPVAVSCATAFVVNAIIAIAAKKVNFFIIKFVKNLLIFIFGEEKKEKTI
jgi:hypothetical protein